MQAARVEHNAGSLFWGKQKQRYWDWVQFLYLADWNQLLYIYQSEYCELEFVDYWDCEKDILQSHLLRIDQVNKPDNLSFEQT